MKKSSKTLGASTSVVQHSQRKGTTACKPIMPQSGTSSSTWLSINSVHMSPYRTRGLTSHVDETLFGTLKQSTCEVKNLAKRGSRTQPRSALGTKGLNPETICTNDLRILNKDPSGQSIILCPAELERIRGKSRVLRKEKRKAIPPTEFLLSYDKPELVSKNTKKNSPKFHHPLKASPRLPLISGPVPPPPKPKSPSSDAIKQLTEEVLNVVLPPKEWIENNQLWEQQVSSMPCTRADVIHLQEELDFKLQERQARDTGVCPIRRELYTQCFDELVRQVTMNCAERGLLLLQVRDEIRMTIADHQTMYEGSMAFGSRKALEADLLKADMEKKIADLENEKRELERQVDEQKAKCEAIKKSEDEWRQVIEKKRNEEIQFLKHTQEQLKAQIKVIVPPPKKPKQI